MSWPSLLSLQTLGSLHHTQPPDLDRDFCAPVQPDEFLAPCLRMSPQTLSLSHSLYAGSAGCVPKTPPVPPSYSLAELRRQSLNRSNHLSILCFFGYPWIGIIPIPLIKITTEQPKALLPTPHVWVKSTKLGKQQKKTKTKIHKQTKNQARPP